MSEKTLGSLAKDAYHHRSNIRPPGTALQEIECWDAAASAIRNAVLEEAHNKIAAWMIAHGLVTGHGDTIDNLLGEIVAGTRAAVLEEAAKQAYSSHCDHGSHIVAKIIEDRIRALKHGD